MFQVEEASIFDTVDISSRLKCSRNSLGHLPYKKIAQK